MRGSKRFGLTHGHQAGHVDLGNEPPLTIGRDDDGAEQAPVRRAVSWRWLTGTVLTGVASIALMGAALMAALDSPNQFAILPDAFAAQLRSDGMVFGEKGDRIQPIDAEASSRQILQVSTVTRQGERDFIKLRPFARIKAALFQSGEISADIPEYDPVRIFADTSEPEPPSEAPDTEVAAIDDQLYGSNVDGEVAVKVSAFPASAPDLQITPGFETAEIERMVRASADMTVRTDAEFAALQYADPEGFEDIPGEEDPFAAADVRIIPENVSNIAKTDPSAGDHLQERIIAVQDGDELRSLLGSNRIGERDADEITRALAQLVNVASLSAGQKLRIAYAEDSAEPEAMMPVRISVYDDGVHQATVARSDADIFVRADEPNAALEMLADAEPEAPAGGPLKVYDAVYQAALDQQIPEHLISQLIRIFAFDLDFQSRIGRNDAMEVLHSLPDSSDADAMEPEVLYASLTLSGTTKRFYRFRTPDDGVVDYYDEEGKSAKKFLMRKPISSGVLRSRFGMRRHPILGYRRMHSGVDYAAPRGTPILAAGNGVVLKAERSSGYGNLTLIKHTNGYVTAYAHQSSFAKGITKGAKVQQGQVIGYVGSTGLSTGPHLHFEMRVNNQAVDPLRIRLPRGRVLQGDFLTAFEHERERIDALIGNEVQPTKVATAN